MNQPQKISVTTAIIGEGTYIYPGCFYRPSCNVLEKIVSFIRMLRSLDYCVIGNNVIIQAGTVIGSDAFYYNTKKDREVWYKKMQSCGRVIIEDDVEIGAGCTIDRGVTHDTLIGTRNQNG